MRHPLAKPLKASPAAVIRLAENGASQLWRSAEPETARA